VQIFRRRGDHGTLHSLHKFEAEMVGLSHQKIANGLVARILLFAASLKHHTAAILPSAFASCAGVVSV